MSETCKLEYFGGSKMKKHLSFHQSILLQYINLRIKISPWKKTEFLLQPHNFSE